MKDADGRDRSIAECRTCHAVKDLDQFHLVWAPKMGGLVGICRDHGRSGVVTKVGQCRKAGIAFALIAVAVLCLAGRERQPAEITETEWVHKIPQQVCPLEGWTLHPAVVRCDPAGNCGTSLFGAIDASQGDLYTVSYRADGRLILCCLGFDVHEVSCTGVGHIQHEPHGPWSRVGDSIVTFPGDLTGP